MKDYKLSKPKQAVNAPRPASPAAKDQDEANFMPSPDEVARKAYFAYENQRSQPGHEVQHWLRPRRN